MSSSVAIVTAVCFGAASALLSFAIDRGVLAQGVWDRAAASPPVGDGWDLRGTLPPTDSSFQVAPASSDRMAQRRQA